MSYIFHTETVFIEAMSQRVFGIVKWFNKKQGFGFIHVLTGEQTEKDVFVHYSSIRSKETTDYKYLVQGEYVEFAIEKAVKENHEFNATDITGICGGPSLCETRRSHEEEEGRGATRSSTSVTNAPPRIRESEGEYVKVVRRKKPL